MSQQRVIVQFALDNEHEFPPNWSHTSPSDIVAMVAGTFAVRAGGDVFDTKAYAGNIYEFQASVCPASYRLFRDNYNAFYEEVFGNEFTENYGLKELSIYA